MINNKKFLKYIAYCTVFVACTVILGPSSEARASDILELGRDIYRQTRYISEDVCTTFERAARPRSNDPLKNALQVINDYLADTWRVIERKIITPLEDLL